MKKCFRSSFLLLAVSVTGVLLNAEVYERGSEGEAAVIKCPYREHYKKFPKYFCKGTYKQCQTLIKTDGKTEWVIDGNLSLNDNKEKNMFVVTINNLRAGDTGRYGCGIEITGQDPFTVVHLTVIMAEKPRLSTAKTTVSTVPTTDVLMYTGGVFGAVLLVFIVTFFKCRVMKDCEGTTSPNTPDTMKEVSVYDEIQLSSPAEENPSETPNLISSPSYYTECKTIYSMITNQKQDPHISLSLPSSPVSCGPNLHRDSTEDLQEPKYSHVEFRDAGDLKHFMKYNDLYSTAQEAVNKPNPIYSEISVSKTDSDPDHADAETPKQETSI
ncbi:polymeric immunoglobulin receptor-like [Silurus meridionalis]|nr:polymeric immunoglobulin receptor-like [Silurus meridionalis]